MQHYFVVQSRAVPGCELEFTDGYADEHFEDVLQVPGVLTARRFRLTDRQRPVGVAPTPSNLALYQFDGDPQVVFEGLDEATASGPVRIGRALDRNRTALLSEPTGPAVSHLAAE